MNKIKFKNADYINKLESLILSIKIHSNMSKKSQISYIYQLLTNKCIFSVDCYYKRFQLI